MSVAAHIDKPTNEFEANFYVPICGEDFYNQYIYPIAHQYQLDLIVNWDTYVAISYDEWDELKQQFIKLLGYLSLDNTITSEIIQHLMKRLTDLNQQVDALFAQNSQAIILIG